MRIMKSRKQLQHNQLVTEVGAFNDLVLAWTNYRAVFLYIVENSRHYFQYFGNAGGRAVEQEVSAQPPHHQEED